MRLSRREFLSRLPSVGFIPTGVLLHHKSWHTGGPKPDPDPTPEPTATYARVAAVRLEAPPAAASSSETYWVAGDVETVAEHFTVDAGRAVYDTTVVVDPPIFHGNAANPYLEV